MNPRCFEKMRRGELVSMLDIMGGYIECDGCGAQTTSGLSPELLRMEYVKKGWTFGAKDLCDKCQPKKR